MNDRLPLGQKALDEFRGKNGAKASDPANPPTDPDDATEADDRCGRSATRGLFQGLILEMKNGNLEGIFYGAILGQVSYNPSVGISFLFESGEGVQQVQILGSNLHGLHRELTLGRRESVRIGEAVADIQLGPWRAASKQ